MITAALLVGLLLALLLSALASGLETGVYCLDRLRLRVACEQNHPRALRLERLVRHPEDALILALLATNAADYLVTACTAALLLNAAVSETRTEVYAAAISTPLILVFGAIIPKDWFRRESNRLLMGLSRPLGWGLCLARLTGLIWLLRSLAHRLAGWVEPGQTGSEGPLPARASTLHLLREGAARGGLTRVQRDLIERVLRLSTVRVTEVMVPRSRAAMVPENIGRDDFLRIARMAHFSRLPVYRDDPRRIVGIANVYDVLTDPEHRPIFQHVRPPLTLAEYVNVSAALLKLQRARQTMAIVQDRAGNCVGLLTLKDLVEEIVGDLEAW